MKNKKTKFVWTKCRHLER